MCFYLLYEICVCLKARVYNDVIKLSCTLEKGQKVNIFKCQKQQFRQRECIHLAIACRHNEYYSYILCIHEDTSFIPRLSTCMFLTEAGCGLGMRLQAHMNMLHTLWNWTITTNIN